MSSSKGRPFLGGMEGFRRHLLSSTHRGTYQAGDLFEASMVTVACKIWDLTAEQVDEMVRGEAGAYTVSKRLPIQIRA